MVAAADLKSVDRNVVPVRVRIPLPIKMITFKPDQMCRHIFDKKIDFDTLSLVYSLLYDSVYKGKKKRNYIIRIYTTASNNSYYATQKGCNVRINISDTIVKTKTFQWVLLHEFRHFLQNKIFKIPFNKKNYDDSTDLKYKSSPIEIDAVNYEHVALPKVLRLYNRLLKIKCTLRNVSDYKGNVI